MANPVLTSSTIGTGFSSTSFNRLELLTLRAHINGLPLDTIAWQYGKISSTGIRALVERAIRTFHAHHKIDGAIALRTLRTDDEDSVHKAIWAINLLEKLSKTKPTLEDPVTSWFLPVLAARLERHGITTLLDLCNRINERGAGFYRPLKGIGAKAAQALIQWITDAQDSLNYPFIDLATSPSLPVSSNRHLVHPGALPVPLERAELSRPMNGQNGSNRGPLLRNRLAADNDLAAIQAWLSLYKDKPHTFRAYRREAERLLLWCIIERGTPLSSLTVEDCQAYKQFLSDPKPTSQPAGLAPRNAWCGARTTRNNPRWRPFEGPLSPRSITYALTVLKALFEWLTRQRYLDVNTFDALPRNNEPTRILVERALSKDAWSSFTTWLQNQTEDHTMHVAYVAALLAGDAGLRRHEIANLTRECLVFDEFWELRFKGKRKKVRTVPLSERSIKAIADYHLTHKQEFLDYVDPSTPLLYPERRPLNQTGVPNQGYCGNSIWRILKLSFKRFANEFGPIDGKDFSKTYPHALRHTFGVHAVRAGVDLDVVSQCLGHSSLTTTTVYTQGDRTRRNEQLKKLHRTQAGNLHAVVL